MIINNSCIQTSQGLPQGWGPSPILFNLYTLELHWHNSEKSKVIQFADDVAVMGFGKVLKEAQENAQTLVNKIYNELQNMKLKVNYRKSKVMKFGDKSREHPTIKIDNKLIEYTNSHKYLGIVIDQKLTFKTHVNVVLEECKKRINFIKSVSSIKYGAHPKCVKTICQSIIFSKLNYGNTVIGNASKTTLEKYDMIHNRCIRLMIGAFPSSPVHAMLVEVGL